MALKVTDENYWELLSGDKPVVLDFWAEWCGPCRTLAPIIDELAKEYEGRVEIGKVDVDENNDIVSKYGIRNIPTVLFFKGGEVVDKQIGAAGKEVLVEKINKLF
jgi:thioredoxin 1